MGKSVYTTLLTVCVLFILSGCAQKADPLPGSELNEPVQLDRTIGSMVNIYQSGAVRIRGFGVVAGLSGTGSSECPPDLRNELVKYIQQQTGVTSAEKANDFINSKDTAVVIVYGMIPALAIKGDHFDVKVEALPNTQTTSLSGGRLLLTELKEMLRVQAVGQYAKTIATAEGPLFFDWLDGNSPDERIGHVLGGGEVNRPVQLALGLIEPNYFAASAIRNQLNTRFGPGTARAVSPAEIQLTFPDKYIDQRAKFANMVRQSFLVSKPEMQQQRIDMLVNRLLTDENKIAAALSLETIGTPALNSLAPLLNNPDEKIRFYAARTMLAIGEDRALGVLVNIAEDQQSDFRISAINSIGEAAKVDKIKRSLRPLLADHSSAVRLAAYEQLLEVRDEMIVRKVVNRDFFIDSVITTGPGLIYVTRSEVPKIVIFGAPLRLDRDIFVKTPGDEVIINASKGDEKISVMRRHPKISRLVGPVYSSYRLSSLVRTLGESPVADENSLLRPGLGIMYDKIILLLQELADLNKTNAEFTAGEMTSVNVP